MWFISTILFHWISNSSKPKNRKLKKSKYRNIEVSKYRNTDFRILIFRLPQCHRTYGGFWRAHSHTREEAFTSCRSYSFLIQTNMSKKRRIPLIRRSSRWLPVSVSPVQRWGSFRYILDRRGSILFVLRFSRIRFIDTSIFWVFDFLIFDFLFAW